MKVDIWGCVKDWSRRGKEFDKEHPYSVKGNVGVQTLRVLKELTKISQKEEFDSERMIRITIVGKPKGKDESVSPVWLEFDSIEEAESLHKHLGEGIGCYHRNEDYEGGETPSAVILI